MTTFKISTLERDTADGFVTVAHWTATQTDGEFTASTYSTVSFTKTDDVNLIPFDSLSEAQVLSWVTDSIGADGVEAIDKALVASISEQKAPKKATGTPWNV